MSKNRNTAVRNGNAEETPPVHTVNPQLNSKTAGFAYSATAVAIIIISLIVGLIRTVAKVENYSDAYWYLSFIASPVAIAAAVGVTLAVRKIPFKQIFPVKCHPKYYLIALLIVFGLFCSLNQINGLILKLLGQETSEHSKMLTEYILSLSGWRAVAAIIVIAVLPAFFEELLFRGVMLNGCERGAGGLKTIFIIGFCFSLMHGSLEQTVYQFIAGCLFAFVAIRAHSILPCILMHFINNALTVVISLLGGWTAEGELVVSLGGNIAMIAVGAVALAGGIVWLALDKRKMENGENGGVKNFFIFAACGIGVFALLWILSLFGVA